MKAIITDMFIDIEGKQKITLQVESLADIEKYKDKELSVDFAEYHKKRSLDANAYCWLLIGKIADILRTSKEEVYIQMLKRYGQGAVVKIPKAKCEMFERAYKYHEKHEKLTDDNCQYYRFWIGSSQYNTKEMSILIDGIVSEAKELGIETMTPAELEGLKERW